LVSTAAFRSEFRPGSESLARIYLAPEGARRVGAAMRADLVTDRSHVLLVWSTLDSKRRCPIGKLGW